MKRYKPDPREPRDFKDILDNAMRNLEVPSYRQLALRIGVTRGAVSAWHVTKGLHKLTDENLTKLSDASGYTTQQILRVIYEQKIKKIQSGLAGIAVFFLLSSLLGPGKAMAGSSYKTTGELFHITHYSNLYIIRIKAFTLSLLTGWARFLRFPSDIFLPRCQDG